MSSPNPAAHPAQDAATGLAGIRVLGSGQGASGTRSPDRYSRVSSARLRIPVGAAAEHAAMGAARMPAAAGTGRSFPV